MTSSPSVSSPEDGPRNPQTFGTADYVRRSIHPSQSEPDVPALHELPRPHIDSFDSIFDDGLLDLAVQNLDPKEIVDSAGNRINCIIYFGVALTYILQSGLRMCRLASRC